MNLLNLSRPESINDEAITVFREAMPRSLSTDLADQALHLLVQAGWEPEQRTSRRFRASSIMPIGETLPVLDQIAEELRVALPSSTMRINWQEPGGKQAWHQDYIPEPIVVYPQGEGFIDLAPNAASIPEARSAQQDGEAIAVPIYTGDVALIHRGGSTFHRGRNKSKTDSRMTIVLH